MAALFRDRLDAGRQLAAALTGLRRRGGRRRPCPRRRHGGCGGGSTASALPLDALAVRKVGYPGQPEYAIGAVTPGAGGVYVRSSEGLDEPELRRS